MLTVNSRVFLKRIRWHAAGVGSSTPLDVNGHYFFTNLLPGAYELRFIKPNNTGWTLQDQGTDEATDSDVDSLGKVVDTLFAGATEVLDAGLYWDLAG